MTLSNIKTFSKPKKILLIVLSIIILLVAACGIGYAVAPRDFLQLVLSDSAYTKVMLAKNLTTYYPEAEKVIEKVNDKKLGFEANGTVKADFEDTAFGTKETTQSIEDYVNTLKVNSSLYLNGALGKATCTLSDNDGTVLNADCIADPSNIYVDIPQLKLGYMSMIKNSDTTQKDVGTINETYDNIITKKADKDLRKAVYDAADTAVGTFDKTLISVIKEKTLKVGSVSATGDVATVVMSADDFRNCITTTFDKVTEDETTFNLLNSCLPESAQMSYTEFKTKAAKIEDKILQKAKDSEITNVTLEFYVNKRNEIVGLDIELLSPKTNIGICVVIKDDQDRGLAINVKEKTDNKFLIDILKTDETCGVIDYYRVTEDGPISIKATYSDLKMSDDALYGHIKTNSFKLPGNKELGAITLDITADGKNEKLSVTAKIKVDDLVNATLYLSANTAEFKTFSLPKAAEITPYDKDLVKSSATSYILTDLPKTHSDFAKIYKSILVSTIGGSVGDLIGALTGNSNPLSTILGNAVNGNDLTNAINGIIDSAINSNSGYVGNIVNDFFSAFGLKK